ncbi:hypothetical protein AVEN_215328-1 [Araneus ventricosus]|uniref:Uncharacterized protein n=1 Tax=Araneus ventricosus TaxID=182803 RepID=A0A4Y2U133_ARAVE|nr:hypothetical protein AVEN_215328-1 [Araneus ventricosus]
MCQLETHHLQADHLSYYAFSSSLDFRRMTPSPMLPPITLQADHLSYYAFLLLDFRRMTPTYAPHHLQADHLSYMLPSSLILQKDFLTLMFPLSLLQVDY